MEKINIAELLKDCPSGMELDSTLFEGLEFDCIVDNEYLPIRCRIKHPNGGYTVYNFTKYGCWLNTTFAKCVIFPKSKTTWEGFIPTYKFKNGDVVSTTDGSWIGITLGGESGKFIPTYCIIDSNNEFSAYFRLKQEWAFNKLATKEEKQKLFDAIKANSYKWNPETKTLEKLIEPKFKVGDMIKYRSGEIVYRVVHITEDSYVLDNLCSIPISIEHMYNLVPNKFDITTLMPFESRVLVRNSLDGLWKPAVFGFRNGYNDNAFYIVGGSCWKQCIPYLNNEHLCGTTNDCDDFYKTWE